MDKPTKVATQASNASIIVANRLKDFAILHTFPYQGLTKKEVNLALFYATTAIYLNALISAFLQANFAEFPFETV
jgi:hypothetical protein